MFSKCLIYMSTRKHKLTFKFRGLLFDTKLILNKLRFNIDELFLFYNYSLYIIIMYIHFFFITVTISKYIVIKNI